MATTEDSESEVELAVTQDIEPGPVPNALFLGQHFAPYTDFKAAMRRWSVTANFETRYEKSGKTVNIVTCRVKECTFRVRAMYRPKLGWCGDYQAYLRAHCLCRQARTLETVEM